MKKYYLLLLYMLPVLALAQSGEWVWMHGSNSANSAGSFGTQGIPSATNAPPAFYEGCEWTDLNGNFWLYGGQHLPGSFYADLWKFDPLTNEWTWIKGPGTPGQVPVYGSKGIPSSTNTPGARGWAPASWTDQSGHLWMFGGCNYTASDMNDLWMYDIGTNQWTWMKGSNTPNSNGNGGVKGVPALSNEPHSRHENACAWKDNNGDLWLFGAYAPSSVDEVWRYSVSTNMWTWMKGNLSVNTVPIYGTIGVENVANTPGSRNTYSRWVDKQGNLWLFGGNGSGATNDLWRYSIVTNNWKWMKGPSTVGDPGSYGTYCVESISNVPSSRFENRSCWTDACGNFWLFGGAQSVGAYNSYNDLWVYSPVTNNWRWINGSQFVNAPASYGTIKVSLPSNVPSSRMGPLSWIDKANNLWMFGGQKGSGTFYYNDLWKFTIDSVCSGSACNNVIIPPVASFQTSDSLICANDCISFTNLSSGALSYQWIFAGAMPASSTDKDPQTVCYFNPGIFDVTLIAFGNGANDTLKLTNHVDVSAVPPTPVITQDDHILYCSTDTAYISYQWYDDSTLVIGATDTSLTINHSGNYNIRVVNKNGCSIAVGINIVLGLQNYMSNNTVTISPNPVERQLTVNSLHLLELEIYNVIGEKQLTYTFSPSNVDSHGKVDPDGFSSRVIDVSALPSGVYFIKLECAKGTVVKRFIKELTK